MQEAGISIDGSIPNWRNNQIVRALNEAFKTDIGTQMLADISAGGGLGFTAYDELSELGPRLVGVSPRGPFGLGRLQLLRGLFRPADEFRAVLMSGIGKSRIMAIGLGHEIGHAVYNYEDNWQAGGGVGPFNLIRIENPLRRQLGVSTMRVHYMGNRVLD
jgi:hypothetical protein